MNIEDEIEWNSHIIKSGRVLGTYEWMMSKGYDLHEINYVVWDTMDNTWEPLAKAVGKATQQHPDILLKNAMRDALQQDQATQFQQRMQAGREAGLNPKPTGAEYMQANKPFSAAYAGLRNVMSGGRYSSGADKLDQQAPSGSDKRFGFLSGVRRPGVAVSSALGARKAGKDHARLSSKVATNDLAMSRLLAGRDPSELSPNELERYKNMERIKQDAQDSLESLDTRGFQARAQDASNKKITDKRPNVPLGQLPFPAREATRGDPAEMTPVEDTTPTGEEPDQEVDAAVQDVGAAAQRAKEGPATGPPAETGAKPEASPASFNFREEMAGLSDPYSTERIRGLNKVFDEMMERTGGKPKEADIREMFKGRRGAPKKAAMKFLMDKFDITPQQAEKLAEKVTKPAAKAAKPAAAKPAAAKPAAEPAPAEPETPEEPTEFVAEPPVTEEEEEILDDDEDNLITSKDTLESLNMAFTFLKSRR